MPKPPSPDSLPGISANAPGLSGETGRMLRAFDINPNGRDFVVGDLHGCIAEFETLLNRLRFDFQKDRMFSVGDLVDRGPDSMACLGLLREPWFFAVMGNHEDMMLNAVASNLRSGVEHWVDNGGDWGVERFEDGDPAFFELIDLADALPYAVAVRTRNLGLVGVTHAEPPAAWTEASIESDSVKLLWSRQKIDAPKGLLKAEGVDCSVHGHTIVEKVTSRDDLNAFWIDLGCYVMGRLCAVQIGGDGFSSPIATTVERR